MRPDPKNKIGFHNVPPLPKPQPKTPERLSPTRPKKESPTHHDINKVIIYSAGQLPMLNSDLRAQYKKERNEAER